MDASHGAVRDACRRCGERAGENASVWSPGEPPSHCTAPSRSNTACRSCIASQQGGRRTWLDRRGALVAPRPTRGVAPEKSLSGRRLSPHGRGLGGSDHQPPARRGNRCKNAPRGPQLTNNQPATCRTGMLPVASEGGAAPPHARVRSGDGDTCAIPQPALVWARRASHFQR